MLPLSLGEIFVDKGFAENTHLKYFEKLLRTEKDLNDIQLPEVTLSNDAGPIIDSYFRYGGLPLAYSATNEEDKLLEILLTVEHGFDLMSVDNNSIAENVKLELANLNSREFTYKYVLTKTRLKRRDDINKVIDKLLNHEYLFKKKLSFLPENKSSYLSTYSYTDPGIVTYLTGNRDLKDFIGHQVESYIHARLAYLSMNSPFKSEVSYYKPYVQDDSGSLKYLPGEIDFIYQQAKRVIPIEVKYSKSLTSIKVSLLENFVKEKKCAFGIVLYGGVPLVDKKVRILYWPYWMI